MKIALITGGLGFIGSFICRYLIENRICEKVVLLDHFGRYTSSLSENFYDFRKLRTQGLEDSIIIERGEAKYHSVLSHLLYTYRPHYIYHLAALPLAKLQNLNTEEALEGTLLTTSHFLEIIGGMKSREGYQPERFVYTSSSMIYGDFESEKISETHPTRPIEIYGTMKLAGEHVTRGLSRYYDIPATIIRPSAVYGPTDMNYRVSQIFLENALKGKELIIQGEDECLDFTYVKDLAKGFVMASQSEKTIGETYNLTYGKSQKLVDFAKILQTHFPELKYTVVPRDPQRPKRGTLCIAKAQVDFGYQPEYDLKKGLEEYIHFVKTHHPDFKKSHIEN